VQDTYTDNTTPKPGGTNLTTPQPGAINHHNNIAVHTDIVQETTEN